MSASGSGSLFLVLILAMGGCVFAVMVLAALLAVFPRFTRTDWESWRSTMVRNLGSLSDVRSRLQIAPRSEPPAASPDTSHPEATSEPPQVAKRELTYLAIPVTSLVSLLLTLVSIWAYVWLTGEGLDLEDLPGVSFLVMLGTAGGCAIGARVGQLAWRQTVLAALGSGIGIMLLSRFAISPFYPGPWDSPDQSLSVAVILLGACLIAAPVFLLPLFDPALRRNGPAPATGLVVACAVGLALLFAVLDVSADADGLQALVLGSGTSALLLFVGLVASLGPPDVRAAAMGSVGILLIPLVIATWALLGGGWFP